MKECKYRLPCNWCDRLNKYCDMVQPIEIKLSNAECEHEWRYEGELGNRHHYRCIKCDTLKAVPLSYLGNV